MLATWVLRLWEWYSYSGRYGPLPPAPAPPAVAIVANRIELADPAEGVQLDPPARRWHPDAVREAHNWALRSRAESRAYALFVSELTAEQSTAWIRDASIVVHGSAGGRYRLDWGRAGNITSRGMRFCAVLDGGLYPSELPVFDVMLAQKLAIEADEAGFLRVARVTSVGRAGDTDL